MLKKGIILLLLMIVAIGCSSEPAESDHTNDSTDRNENSGGELRVALDAQPPTLDEHTTTAAVTRYTGRHIFETLVMTNSKYEVVPMLAESIEKSDDGKTYTFKLREGVTFHNGKEMTAEDVVASMDRWKELSPVAGDIFKNAIFKEEDPYTVTLELEKPSLSALDIMASRKQSAAIMPKEMVENAGLDGVSEYIGTGPFKFKEWQQDQYIHLTKYEDYQPVDSEADGLTGKKEALVDDLYFEFVLDPSTRLAGIETGEYDVAYGLPHDNYEQLKENPNANTYIDQYGNFIMVYNKKGRLFTNAKMRQAVNAALDADDIMLAAFSNKDLYWMDSGYMNVNIEHWASDRGKEEYNQKDPEKAKKRLEEAGYNGEEIIILTTRDYEYHYSSAIVVQEQLENIGMNVKLDVYDWPTLKQRETDPELWDILPAGISITTTPNQLLELSSTWAGWTDDETVTKALESMESAANQEEAKPLWDDLQEDLWKDYVPVSKIGIYSSIFASTDKVEGLTIFEGPVLWNTRVVE